MNKFIFRPWLYNIIPVLVWFLILILPFLSSTANPSLAEHKRFLWHIVLSNILLLIFFYIHTFALYPIIKKNGIALYIITLIVLIAAYWYTSWLIKFTPAHNPNFAFNNDRPGDHFGPPPFNHGPGEFMPFISTVIVLLCSFCYRIILENNTRNELLKEQETAHLRTELSFLRSQVNPHFLFNVLNNLTSLARKRSDQLEPAIVSLSQIMRYMLYDSSDNKVTLAKEIEYLESYINLQRLRFGEELNIEVMFGGNINNCMLEPMLFIPLVENAFKYGVERVNDNLIIVGLSVNEDQSKLNFKVVNSYDAVNRLTQKGEGVGLKNIKRRLDLLYPDKHELLISINESRYIVELSLELI